MQSGQITLQVKKDLNLFILELVIPNKAIACEYPIYLVKKNKKKKIRHYRFAYINNTRIIKASKLLTNIENFKKE